MIGQSVTVTVTRLQAFSRAWHVFAGSSYWFVSLFTSVVIGQTVNLGFGLASLNRKPFLWALQCVILSSLFHCLVR